MTGSEVRSLPCPQIPKFRIGFGRRVMKWPKVRFLPHPQAKTSYLYSRKFLLYDVEELNREGGRGNGPSPAVAASARRGGSFPVASRNCPRVERAATVGADPVYLRMHSIEAFIADKRDSRKSTLSAYGGCGDLRESTRQRSGSWERVVPLSGTTSDARFLPHPPIRNIENKKI